MNKLNITVLGSGTSLGVPVIGCGCDVCSSTDARDNRLRSSVLIQYQDKNIVIDCGPDFRKQMLSAGVKDIDAILFTHEHRDHTGGLDDIRAYNYVHRKKIPIYATEKVISSLKQQYDYIFADRKYEGVPEVSINVIDGQAFKVDGVEVIPIEAMHFKLPVFAYRIKDFTYITDASSISETELKKIDGTRVLIINALRNTPHFSHFSVQEALEIIDRIKPEKAFLTHISHLMGKHESVNPVLPENVFLAYDGLKFTI